MWDQSTGGGVGFVPPRRHTVALEMFPSITPEMFAGTPMEEAYLCVAPNPGDFPTLVLKLKELDTTDFAWRADDIRAIAAPTFIVLGDSDGVRLQHAVELFELRGGGVMGDCWGCRRRDRRCAEASATVARGHARRAAPGTHPVSRRPPHRAPEGGDVHWE